MDQDGVHAKMDEVLTADVINIRRATRTLLIYGFDVITQGSADLPPQLTNEQIDDVFEDLMLEWLEAFTSIFKNMTVMVGSMGASCIRPFRARNRDVADRVMQALRPKARLAQADNIGRRGSIHEDLESIAQRQCRKVLDVMIDTNWKESTVWKLIERHSTKPSERATMLRRYLTSAYGRDHSATSVSRHKKQLKRLSYLRSQPEFAWIIMYRTSTVNHFIGEAPDKTFSNVDLTIWAEFFTLLFERISFRSIKEKFGHTALTIEERELRGLSDDSLYEDWKCRWLCPFEATDWYAEYARFCREPSTGTMLVTVPSQIDLGRYPPQIADEYRIDWVDSITINHHSFSL